MAAEIVKVPPEKAIKSKTLSEGKVTLEFEAGWEHVLDGVSDDDPALLIIWLDNHVSATVAAFNAAIAGGAVAPAWLTNHRDHLTAAGLKTAIFTFARNVAGGGGRVLGNALIAPNTMVQYNNIHTALSFLGFDPFFRDHAVCPIGTSYVFLDMAHTTTGVPHAVLAPPVGQGVNVFA